MMISVRCSVAFIAPSNTQKTLQQCVQAGQNAASSVPSPVPSGQDLIDAVGGAAVGGAAVYFFAPEEAATGPAAPVAVRSIYKVAATAGTIFTGFLRTAASRLIQKAVVASVTTQGCLISAGVPNAATPSIF
jgi:hypothetical protein